MTRSFQVDEDVVLEVKYQNNLLPALFPNAPTTVLYKGKVINRKPYDDPHSIRIFTGEKEMMIRVVMLKNVLKVNGEEFHYDQPEAPKVSKVQTVMVKGSTGKDYVITIHPSGSMTCTCSGFGFRRKCSHIEKIVNNARAT